MKKKINLMDAFKDDSKKKVITTPVEKITKLKTVSKTAALSENKKPKSKAIKVEEEEKISKIYEEDNFTKKIAFTFKNKEQYEAFSLHCLKTKLDDKVKSESFQSMVEEFLNKKFNLK